MHEIASTLAAALVAYPGAEEASDKLILGFLPPAAAITAMVVGALILIGLMTLVAYSKLYRRATAHQALVRTGRGGMKVAVGGGVWSIPIFHEVQYFSLRQIKISINRTGKDALIASDKIKADVEGTMFVRVGDAEDDIKLAAKTFGEVNDRQIEVMIADKVTDAMRAEGMKMSFLDLNVNKREFAEAIGAAVQADLAKTGLVLDSVAITSIRQVEIDPSQIPMDVFEAEGTRNIVEIVERNRKATNDIRKRTDLEVQKVDVDARKQALAMELEQKEAEADQRRQIEEYTARQVAEAKRATLEQERIAEEAAIAKDEQVAMRELAKAQTLAVEQAGKDQAEQVAQARAEQAAEEAEIAKGRAVAVANIEKARTAEAAQVEREQTIETAQVAKQQAIAQAEEAKALALAQQALAEAEAERAQQAIKTVGETATADRARQVAVLKAEEEARKVVLAAEAERDARQARAEAEAREAEARARALREQARGMADAAKIEAEGNATATLTKAEADGKAADLNAMARAALAEATLAEGKAEAESRHLAVAAENEVARDLVVRDVLLKLVGVAPDAIREFMAPAAAISDVKVLNLHGFGGDGANGNGKGLQSGLPGIVTGALAQSVGLSPIIQALLSFAKDAGLADQGARVLSDAAAKVREFTGGNGADRDDDGPGAEVSA